VAPALAAGPDDTRPASRTAAADQRAVLRGQTGALAGLGTVLTPVTRLLDAALAADDDPLTAAEAEKLAEAAREAVAQAREEALAEAEKELAAAREEAEQAREEAAEAREEALTEAGVDTGTTASNLTPGALDGLGKAVEDLLTALLSGGTGQVDPAADKVVKKLVDVSVATLLDRGLPATRLPGLPSTETGTGA
jgi:F0F1-type ATP synthase membrane subunit b/b'